MTTKPIRRHLQRSFITRFTAEVGADGGGTVSGGGDGDSMASSVTLTATAGEGYTFDGWYDGDTKVCDTAEFVVDNVTADKTYTAKVYRESSPQSPSLFSTRSGRYAFKQD